MLRPPPRPTLFPYTTLFRSNRRTVGELGRAIWRPRRLRRRHGTADRSGVTPDANGAGEVLQPTNGRRSNDSRSEEHTSELQSQSNLVCRLLLEKKKRQKLTL